MKLDLSPAAITDLQSISIYTRKTWGEAQESRYLADLWQAMTRILEDPESSKDRSELLDRCRSVRMRKHVIFFAITNDVIEVVRILHVAMDFSRHFDSDI